MSDSLDTFEERHVFNIQIVQPICINHTRGSTWCAEASTLTCYNFEHLMTPAGIYIHIPFCRSRCSYCDFATGIYDGDRAEKYVDAVTREIASWREVSLPVTVDTIYFGGGTPSLLEPRQLERILDRIETRFSVAANKEITIEINPGLVGAGATRGTSEEALREFRRLGINRASFGAQTFNDRELARLGRSHTAEETRQTFHSLRRAGFDNVSFDLIAGLPGQTLDGWLQNLEEAFTLQPEHLSFYLLEVHQGTPLAEHIRRGIQPQPDEDLAAAMYEVMLERAVVAGYEHYEISNLCRPGYESRHNSKYWSGAPYYGFGCSAHSYDGRVHRWSNERDPARYVELIANDQPVITERIELTGSDAYSESIFLGLRLMRGISVKKIQEQFGVDIREEHRQDLDRFRQAGLLEFDGDLIRLTRQGALVSNEVFAAFV